MTLKKVLSALFACLIAALALPNPLFAELFGKNQVRWEDTNWKYCGKDCLKNGELKHFAFYIGLDVAQNDVIEHLNASIGHFEKSYDSLSKDLDHQIEKRIIVIITRTHSTFEGLNISGHPSMPEGVGAFATMRGSRVIPNGDLVLVIKPDFLPNLNRTICTHELAHIFQFDMVGWSLFEGNVRRIPLWLFEGGAEYLAGRSSPYARDDIRRRSQRFAAANFRNTMTGVPTLEMLNWGYADPYSRGAMVFEFLEHKFGERRVLEFYRRIFKDCKRTRFMPALEDLSGGEFKRPEDFDRAHRNYWASVFADDSLRRPKPYDTTAAYRGRQILNFPWPYRLTSPVMSPDGASVAFITTNAKRGLVIGTVPAPIPDELAYVPNPDHRNREKLRRKFRNPIKLVTKSIPPERYEYLIAQEQIVWPFNGSDLDWWQEPEWAEQSRQAYLAFKTAEYELSVAKSMRKEPELLRQAAERLKEASAAYRELQQVSGVSKLAYFARKNRDHALFIQDVHTGKMLAVIELPLDQAFSPSFSPDGETIYFSASKNLRRDIYAVRINGASAPERITTDGTFNSAPAVSPDGTKLVYVAFVGDRQKLFLRDMATGTVSQLTGGGWNDNSPSWSSDGTTLVYTSDRKDGIWNLYTLELVTKTVRQWTDFYGGAYTPSFAPGENNRVLFSAYIEDDQNNNVVHPNFELFDLRLKEPLAVIGEEEPATQKIAEQKTEETENAPVIDREKLQNSEPPARWKLYDSDIVIFGSTRGGFAGYAGIEAQDLLRNRIHSALFAKSRHLMLGEYNYLDQSGRLSWSVGASFAQYPLVFRLSGLWGQFPQYPEPFGSSYQYFLSWTRLEEKGVSFTARYPLSKWSRIEAGTRVRKRQYRMQREIPEENIYDIPPELYNSDKQFSDYFNAINDNSTHASVNAAFVHDTILYSESAMGPVNGSALRAQAEFGYPLGAGTSSFSTFSFSARQYLRITRDTVFAVRADGMYSTRPNGDAMYLGGNDSLRNYPYYSVACDRCLTGSAEFRFPLGDAFLLKMMPLRLRGILFGDTAIVRMSSQQASARQEYAYGFGVQVWLGVLPVNFEWARTGYSPEKFDFNVRVGLSF